MDLILKDKIIIVTGGAKGIGAAITQILSSEDAIPFVIGRNEKDNVSIVREIEAKIKELFI